MVDDHKPEDETFEDDEFDTDFGDDLPDDDFGAGDGAGDAIRNNPVLKIAIVGGGLLLIVAAVLLFGGNEEEPDAAVARVGEANTVQQAPGTEEVSQAYREAVEEANQQQIEEAISQGQSAIPTPVTPSVEVLQAPEEPQEEEDPLARWRRIQEERAQQREQQARAAERFAAQAQQQQVEAEEPDYAETIQSLAEAMAAQMDILSDRMTSMQGMEHSVIGLPDTEEDGEGAEDGRDGSGDGGGEQEEIVNVLIPAGTIVYAQTLLEANSDVPGPVLAQIAGGQLSGSRIIGEFSVEEEHLVIRFNTVVIDGISYSINAIALDPDTTLPAVVTDIDRRLFRRLVLPAAAAFVEGLGEAISEQGSTTVTVQNETVTEETEDLDVRGEFFSALEEGFSEVSDFVDEQSESVEPLIVVRSGTPIGLLFIEAFTDEEMNSNQSSNTR